MPSTRYQLLSVIQAAEQLGLTRWFVYDEIYKRRLPHHRIGGRISISQHDLDAYVARSRVSALGEKKTKTQSAMEVASSQEIPY